MTNFSINFSNPWLLLLLIPAVGLTLLPYFRSNKRYRRTRNRIVSMVLHLIIMILAISVLAGTTFEYDLPNEENEIILLVDSSFSNEGQNEKKEEFIQSVIYSNNSAFRLGIVTFGYDQVNAVPITGNMNNVYNNYLKSPAPDESATDIEAALLYAQSLLKYPQSSRIILLSDAYETDGKALDVIKKIAATGIKVDTVYFPEGEPDIEVEIVGMEMPENKVKRAEEFEVQLLLQSSYTGSATITPYDNEVAGQSITVNLQEGIQKVSIPFTFTTPELHTLNFEMTSTSDTLTQNNTYTSYIYVPNYNNVLILESISNESQAIVRMLGDEFKTTVLNISDANVPTTVSDLRMYDEVILCNIANKDMPAGFDEVLHEYVEEIGGGLFTVCGNDVTNASANAYTKDDMHKTLYEKLLPVEIINYTPPVAVMVLIDSSGSMLDNEKDINEQDMKGDPGTKLYYAKGGARECLELLSERDFMGVYSLADVETEQIQLTACTKRDAILGAIDRIEGPGGTIFSSALEKAGSALMACSDVEKRHIIIITDGEPSEADIEATEGALKINAQNGITTSIIGIGATSDAKSLMETLLTEYAGVSEDNFHGVADGSEVPDTVKEDLAAPEIVDVNYETFTPTIKVVTSITEGVATVPSLDGFYGMRAKQQTDTNGLEVILSTKYTPLYTQWNYGNGRVGTFACDLSGMWSAEFISSPDGEKIVRNIVSALLPTSDIRIKSIDIELSGDNYKTDVNIYSELNEGEYFEIKVTSPQLEGGESVNTYTAGDSENYTKISFEVTTPGVHRIDAYRKNSSGEILAETTEYKALAYSKEYELFYDRDSAELLSTALAEGGKGVVIDKDNPWQVYENAADFLHKVIDPALAFTIAIICMFLLDIAVRKFKWKWIHEIIRDKRAKEEMEKTKG